MQIAELMSQMGAGKALVTFIISMLPVVELRLAIPMGVSLGLSSGAVYHRLYPGGHGLAADKV
jgi:hypothetical protein